MSIFSNPRVTRRFVILMAVATFFMFTFWAVLKNYVSPPEGDYEVRQGDIFLSDKKYDKALDRFNAALLVTPDHRGALTGRALVYLQTERYVDAEAEFTYLIDFLTRTLEDDDPTGRGTLAAAYANRGIMHDRMGQYQKALDDYVMSIKTDEGAVDGPTVMDKILYTTPNPSTVRKRAIYIYEQLQLPENERVLRIPEEDAKQRMYKP